MQQPDNSKTITFTVLAHLPTTSRPTNETFLASYPVYTPLRQSLFQQTHCKAHSYLTWTLQHLAPGVKDHCHKKPHQFSLCGKNHEQLHLRCRTSATSVLESIAMQG